MNIRKASKENISRLLEITLACGKDLAVQTINQWNENYPSKEAFIEMSTSEAYKKISHDREISLEYGGLLATETIGAK